MHRHNALRVLIGLVLAVAAVSPAVAHHSFAMYDGRKTLTLDGTVKDFQWTNPHTWVQLLVKDPTTGREVEWSIEGGATVNLTKDGWKHSSMKPGDKARIVIHPLRNGSNGGSLVSAVVNGVFIGVCGHGELKANCVEHGPN